MSDALAQKAHVRTLEILFSDGAEKFVDRMSTMKVPL
jgi:hypothetical protein